MQSLKKVDLKKRRRRLQAVAKERRNEYQQSPNIKIENKEKVVAKI